jgi:hypothetical protein
VSTVESDKPVRQQITKAIRKLIMRSDSYDHEALLIIMAVEKAQRDRFKKDGKKPIDPERFIRALALTT